MSAIIGIEIDRRTGQIISADMPPANMDVKALWDRELKPGTLYELWLDCLEEAEEEADGDNQDQYSQGSIDGERGTNVPVQQIPRRVNGAGRL